MAESPYRRLRFTALEPVQVDGERRYDSGAKLDMAGEFYELGAEERASYDLQAVEELIAVSLFRFPSMEATVDVGWRIALGTQRYEVQRVEPTFRKLKLICKRVPGEA